MSDITKRLPMNATFELTGRCNLSCKMCLVRVGRQRIEEMGLRERTAEEWIAMAREAYEAGTLTLLLTGGEVLLRPDFPIIYEAIAKMGFVLTVYTNATMVTDEIMELFRRLPPHKIGVTMYGASNETYEKLCGCKDGFDRFVRGVQVLSTLPSIFEVRTTIVKDNVADLPRMRSFVKAAFGDEKVLQVSRSVVNVVRGGIACPKEVRLSPCDNIDMIYPGLNEIAEKIKGETNPLLEEVRSRVKLMYDVVKPEEGYLFSECNAGIYDYAINWAGRMYACELLGDGYTEPFKEGLKTAWDRLPECYPLMREIPACSQCEKAPFCHTCPAIRYAETGDWFGIPSYSCEEAAYFKKLLEDMDAI